MKNYPALMQSLDSLGKVENVTVQRQDRTGTQIDEANAPADISIQVYSQGNIVSHQSGPLATLRRTLAQSAGAIMWSRAHDWGRDCISCAVGNCDRCDRLDRETGGARATVSGARCLQRVGWRRSALGPSGWRREGAPAPAIVFGEADPPAHPVTQTSLPAPETNHKLCSLNEEAPNEF